MKTVLPGKLRPEVAQLLAAERDVLDPAQEARERVRARLEATLGITVAAGIAGSAAGAAAATATATTTATATGAGGGAGAATAATAGVGAGAAAGAAVVAGHGAGVVFAASIVKPVLVAVASFFVATAGSAIVTEHWILPSSAPDSRQPEASSSPGTNVRRRLQSGLPAVSPLEPDTSTTDVVPLPSPLPPRLSEPPPGSPPESPPSESPPGSPPLAPSISGSAHEPASMARPLLQPQPDPTGRDRRRPPSATGQAGGREHDSLAAERAILGQARSFLAQGKPMAAIKAAARHAQRFRAGQLTEEREALSIQALIAAGRSEAAIDRANSFRQRFPRSILLPVVEQAISGIPKTATKHGAPASP
ncbi:MAG: hypothetical protein V2A73_10050 [Pseudomonadota bacterium]